MVNFRTKAWRVLIRITQSPQPHILPENEDIEDSDFKEFESFRSFLIDLSTNSESKTYGLEI
jgi:hypothetical protein